MSRLRERSVLIVEDEYVVAIDLRMALEEEGAHIVGPVASLQDALDVIASDVHLDVAVLDINLQGERVFPIADALQKARVPFLFTTGYDRFEVPRQHWAAPLYQKPVSNELIRTAVTRAVSAQGSTPPSSP